MSIFSDHMNAEIDEKISSGSLVIDVSKLAENLYKSSSIDHMTIGELRMAYTKQRLAIAMFERGYRSVIRGKGYYANPDEVSKKEYAERIIQNAEMSETQKTKALNLVRSGITNNKNIIGQLEFDENFNIVVSKSDEEILELLSKEV